MATDDLVGLRARGQALIERSHQARQRASEARDLAVIAARGGRDRATVARTSEVRRCLDELAATEESLEKALRDVRHERTRVAHILGAARGPGAPGPHRILRFPR